LEELFVKEKTYKSESLMMLTDF